MYPVIFVFGPLVVYSFGVLACLAFLLSSFVIWKRGGENHIANDDIFDILITLTLWGLLGARVFYVVFHFKQFGFDLVKWFSLVSLPGFMFLGGVLTGIFGLYYLCKKKRLEFYNLADIIVTGLSLGQSIGWIGALLSGFGMGKETSSFGLRFGGYDDLRFPSQIVWTLGFFGLFLYLYGVENKYRLFSWYKGRRTFSQTGFLTFSYLIGYGLLQFLAGLTTDFSVYFFGMRADFIYACGIMFLGFAGLYWRSGRVLKEDLYDLRLSLRSFGYGLWVIMKTRERKKFREARRLKMDRELQKNK